MDDETLILKSLSDVPDPPMADRLSISGCTVVCYHAHRFVSPSTLSEAFKQGVLETIDDDRSYGSKLRQGSGFHYSSFIDSGPVPSALARVVGSHHATRMPQSVLWFGAEYAVSAVPIVLSVPQHDHANVELAKPLTVDGLLRVLALLSDREMAESIGSQVAAALTARLGGSEGIIAHTWSVPGSFAIQIWNLDGTPGRDTTKLYEGIRESAKYSWEISALLSYSSDHLLENGLWLRRSRQQVYSQVRSGSGFLEDHMVFVNADCCLEMAHLPAWLRDRSDFRLRTYGYDSSSIFVWGIGVLRTAASTDLGRRYRDAIDDLIDRRSITAAEQALMVRAQIRHARLVEDMVNLRGHLVEARNRALDEKISTDRATHRGLSGLMRDLDKYGALLATLHRVHEESELARRDLLLAIVALALAGLQIPEFVGGVTEWIRDGRWALLTISITLIAAPIAYVWRLLRRSGLKSR